MSTPTTMLPTPPTAAQLGARVGLSALKALRSGFGGILPILEMVQRDLGDIFQLTLPGFSPVFVASPDALRQVLVQDRDAYLWRPADDPGTRRIHPGHETAGSCRQPVRRL